MMNKSIKEIAEDTVNEIEEGKDWRVYFIRSGKKKNHPVKIGYTSKLGRRLTQIQTHNPYPVELVCSIVCESKEHAQKLERFLHRQLYHRCHLTGEWFNLYNVNLKSIIEKFNTSHKQMFPDFEPVNLESGKKLTVGSVLKKLEEVEEERDYLLERVNELEEQLCISYY